ncbi:hypothetical protein LCGC14_1126940, partial [marine sediment metagenome]
MRLFSYIMKSRFGKTIIGILLLFLLWILLIGSESRPGFLRAKAFPFLTSIQLTGSSTTVNAYGNWVFENTPTGVDAGGWTDDGTTIRLTTATDVVNIGTANAGTALQIEQANAYLTLKNVTAENGQDEAETRIIGEDHANNALAQIQFHHENAADDFKGGMRLFTNTGAALTAAVWIDENQMVGIGRTPTNQLDVFGSGNQIILAETSTNSAFAGQNSKADGSGFLSIGFAGSANSSTKFGITQANYGTIVTLTAGNGLLIGNVTNTPIIIGTNDLERMRILATGDVTIGVAGSSEITPTLSITGDADSDAADTDETFAITLIQASDPTDATHDFTMTQALGYKFFGDQGEFFFITQDKVDENMYLESDASQFFIRQNGNDAVTWTSHTHLHQFFADKTGTGAHITFQPSDANIELTDQNARQGLMFIFGEAAQGATAAFDALYVNATLTSLGDGSTGDGNNLLNLSVSGSPK